MGKKTAFRQTCDIVYDRDLIGQRVQEAQQIRSLDPVTLAFAACLGNVKEETFRCCTSRQ